MIITAHRHHLRAKAIERGYDPDHAMQAILPGEAGPIVRVDTTHPAYPHDAAVVSLTSWHHLHEFARQPGMTLARAEAAVLRITQGNDRRRHQLLAYIAEHPIDPDNFPAWCVGLHDYVNGLLKKPALNDRSYVMSDQLIIHNSATGLGDAISGLYVACGLADATGKPVLYRSHSAKWLAGVTHPGLTIEPIEQGAIGVDINGGPYGYKAQIETADTRTGAYAANAAKGLNVDPFEPTRPATAPTPKPHPTHISPYVVLAPFSCYSSREWPAAKWTQLANDLHAQGLGIIAIGSGLQGTRLEKAFGRTKASWLFGYSAADVVELIQGAACVVGNDSGIVHVGGLLGVPTVCVHAGSLPHDFLFNHAASVVSVTASGDVQRSDHAPEALASIDVASVLTAALDAATATPGGLGSP